MKTLKTLILIGLLTASTFAAELSLPYIKDQSSTIIEVTASDVVGCYAFDVFFTLPAGVHGRPNRYPQVGYQCSTPLPNFAIYCNEINGEFRIALYSWDTVTEDGVIATVPVKGQGDDALSFTMARAYDSSGYVETTGSDGWLTLY